MKRLIKRAAAAAALALCPGAALAAESESKTAIYLVIENGAVVTDPESSVETIRNVLGELVQLRRKRDLKDSEIAIILTANPTEVTWSGTPGDLYEQGQAVLDLITFKSTCSDLVLAWDQVSVTARITMPDEIDLIAIGPAIHAGFPCDQGEQTITLPQAAPEGLKLGEIAASARLLRLFNVHPDQDEVYADHLAQWGVLDRAKAGELDLDLMDAARTRAAYGRLLGGRR